jgi:hypothetical protein
MKKKDVIICLSIIAVCVIVISLYPRQTGYIRIETPGVKMKLGGNWLNSKTVKSSNEPVAINAQIYRPKRIYITQQDGSNKWQLTSYGPWGSLAKISVKRNETTVLKLGPPFLIRAEVRQNKSNSQRAGGLRTLVSVDYAIIGRAGEHYKTYVTKNSRRQTAPSVRIVSDTGEVLAKGKFEYG